MLCCSGCFGDRGLQRNIFPLRSRQNGDCTYCGATDTAIVRPQDLAEYFQLLASAYQEHSDGQHLVYWFRRDWGLFEHNRINDRRAEDLLRDILEDGDLIQRRFMPVDAAGMDRLGEWERLREELMYRNRFFPAADIDLERLEQLLSHLSIESSEVLALWFRARIQTSTEPFSIDEMGAPPNRVSSHGRANPAGIPYLYVASTETTAVSEIRPHAGETVCVADFAVPAHLRLVDLRAPREAVSPFLLADARDIARMRNDLPFLERLGDELTRPVVPQSAAIDYTPSQYLCEFIKKCGYAGVVYRSSVGDGMNLALFNPSLAHGETVKQYRVARVGVQIERVS